jgi:hypothetical protein
VYAPPLLGRCESALSNAGENTPTDEEYDVGVSHVPMRDALANVFLAYKSELPVSVKDGALRAVGTPGVVTKCTALPCLRNMSWHGIAFCLLNAVARAQRDDGAMARSFVHGVSVTQLNVSLANRIKLDLAIAEEATTAIKQIIPSAAISEAAATNEDDYFA